MGSVSKGEKELTNAEGEDEDDDEDIINISDEELIGFSIDAYTEKYLLRTDDEIKEDEKKEMDLWKQKRMLMFIETVPEGFVFPHPDTPIKVVIKMIDDMKRQKARERLEYVEKNGKWNLFLNAEGKPYVPENLVRKCAHYPPDMSQFEVWKPTFPLPNSGSGQQGATSSIDSTEDRHGVKSSIDSTEETELINVETCKTVELCIAEKDIAEPRHDTSENIQTSLMIHSHSESETLSENAKEIQLLSCEMFTNVTQDVNSSTLQDSVADRKSVHSASVNNESYLNNLHDNDDTIKVTVNTSDISKGCDEIIATGIHAQNKNISEQVSETDIQAEVKVKPEAETFKVRPEDDTMDLTTEIKSSEEGLSLEDNEIENGHFILPVSISSQALASKSCIEVIDVSDDERIIVFDKSEIQYVVENDKVGVTDISKDCAQEIFEVHVSNNMQSIQVDKQQCHMNYPVVTDDDGVRVVTAYQVFNQGLTDNAVVSQDLSDEAASKAVTAGDVASFELNVNETASQDLTVDVSLAVPDGEDGSPNLMIDEVAKQNMTLNKDVSKTETASEVSQVMIVDEVSQNIVDNIVCQDLTVDDSCPGNIVSQDLTVDDSCLAITDNEAASLEIIFEAAKQDFTITEDVSKTETACKISEDFVDNIVSQDLKVDDACPAATDNEAASHEIIIEEVAKQDLTVNEDVSRTETTREVSQVMIVDEVYQDLVDNIVSQNFRVDDSCPAVTDNEAASHKIIIEEAAKQVLTINEDVSRTETTSEVNQAMIVDEVSQDLVDNIVSQNLRVDDSCPAVTDNEAASHEIVVKDVAKQNLVILAINKDVSRTETVSEVSQAVIVDKTNQDFVNKVVSQELIVDNGSSVVDDVSLAVADGEAASHDFIIDEVAKQNLAINKNVNKTETASEVGQAIIVDKVSQELVEKVSQEFVDKVVSKDLTVDDVSLAVTDGEAASHNLIFDKVTKQDLAINKDVSKTKTLCEPVSLVLIVDEVSQDIVDKVTSQEMTVDDDHQAVTDGEAASHNLIIEEVAKQNLTISKNITKTETGNEVVSQVLSVGDVSHELIDKSVSQDLLMDVVIQAADKDVSQTKTDVEVPTRDLIVDEVCCQNGAVGKNISKTITVKEIDNQDISLDEDMTRTMTVREVVSQDLTIIKENSASMEERSPKEIKNNVENPEVDNVSVFIPEVEIMEIDIIETSSHMIVDDDNIAEKTEKKDNISISKNSGKGSKIDNDSCSTFIVSIPEEIVNEVSQFSAGVSVSDESEGAKKKQESEEVKETYVLEVTEKCDSEEVKGIYKFEEVKEKYESEVNKKSESEEVKEKCEWEEVNEKCELEEITEKYESDEVKGKYESDEVKGKYESEDVNKKCKSEEVKEKCDSEDVKEKCDSEDVKEKCDSENVKKKSELKEVTEKYESEEVKWKFGSDEVKWKFGSDEVNKKYESDEVNKKYESEEVKEKCDSEDVKEKCDSEGVKEKCDSEGVKEKCDSENVKEKCDSEGVKEKCDSENVKEKSELEEVTEKYESDEVKWKFGSEEVNKKFESEEIKEKCDSEDVKEKCDSEEIKEKCELEEVTEKYESDEVKGKFGSEEVKEKCELEVKYAAEDDKCKESSTDKYEDFDTCDPEVIYTEEDNTCKEFSIGKYKETSDTEDEDFDIGANEDYGDKETNNDKINEFTANLSEDDKSSKIMQSTVDTVVLESSENTDYFEKFQQPKDNENYTIVDSYRELNDEASDVHETMLSVVAENIDKRKTDTNDSVARSVTVSTISVTSEAIPDTEDKEAGLFNIATDIADDKVCNKKFKKAENEKEKIAESSDDDDSSNTVLVEKICVESRSVKKTDTSIDGDANNLSVKSVDPAKKIETGKETDEVMVVVTELSTKIGMNENNAAEGYSDDANGGDSKDKFEAEDNFKNGHETRPVTDDESSEMFENVGETDDIHDTSEQLSTETLKVKVEDDSDNIMQFTNVIQEEHENSDSDDEVQVIMETDPLSTEGMQTDDMETNVDVGSGILFVETVMDDKPAQIVGDIIHEAEDDIVISSYGKSSKTADTKGNRNTAVASKSLKISPHVENPKRASKGSEVYHASEKIINLYMDKKNVEGPKIKILEKREYKKDVPDVGTSASSSNQRMFTKTLQSSGNAPGDQDPEAFEAAKIITGMKGKHDKSSPPVPKKYFKRSYKDETEALHHTESESSTDDSSREARFLAGKKSHSKKSTTGMPVSKKTPASNKKLGEKIGNLAAASSDVDSDDVVEIVPTTSQNKPLAKRRGKKAGKGKALKRSRQESPPVSEDWYPKKMVKIAMPVEDTHEDSQDSVVQVLPQQQQEPLVLRPIKTGDLVFAKWKDKNYYAAKVGQHIPNKNKWRILFNDGAKLDLMEKNILNIECLPSNFEVLVFKDDSECLSDYYTGTIMEVKREETGCDEVMYYVSFEGGDNYYVPHSHLALQDSHVGELKKRLGIQVFSDTDGSPTADHTVSPATSGERTEASGKSLTPTTLFMETGSSFCVDIHIAGLDVELCSPVDNSREHPQKSKTSKSAKQSSSALLGPIPPEGSNLFIKKSFLFTSSNETVWGKIGVDLNEGSSDDPPFDHTHLLRQLQNGGAVIYDRFEDISYNDYPYCYLIANKPVCTATYIKCVLHGIKAINYKWVIDVCKAENPDIRPVCLPAGWSLEKSKWVSYTPSQKYKQPLLKKNILVVGDSEFVNFWCYIVTSLGGKTTRCLTERTNINHIKTTHLFGIISHPSHQQEVYRHVNKQALNVPVLTTAWILQCVVNRKCLAVESHPSYIYKNE